MIVQISDMSVQKAKIVVRLNLCIVLQSYGCSQNLMPPITLRVESSWFEEYTSGANK